MQAIIMRFVEGPGRGVITTAEARKLGCSLNILRGMARGELLERVVRGSYVSTAALNPPPDHPAAGDRFALKKHRHLLRLDAVLRSYGAKVAASHQSAALAWGLPVLPGSLDRVHVVHSSRGRTARRFETLSLHTCELDDVITRHDGRRVVTPALAVIGLAMEVGMGQGVAAMDAAMVAELTTRDELSAMLPRLRHWPRVGLASRALELADGLAESPPETSLRLILMNLGHVYIAQHWVRVGDLLYYRVDFYLPELGVVLEYDGGVKYATQTSQRGAPRARVRTKGPRAPSDNGSDSSGREALIAEKNREDALRLDGFGVGRVTASDLSAAKVAMIIKKAAQQSRPNARHRKAEPPPWAKA